jgi:iron complex outermembrane receptor protein
MNPLRHLFVTAPLAVCVISARAEGQTFNIHIPAQPLPAALEEMAAQTGVKPFYSDQIVAGKIGHAVFGRLTAAQTLQQLLSGTGLSFKFNGDTAVAITRPESDAEATLPAVNVEGRAVYDSTDPYNSDYHLPNASAATKTDTPILEIPMSIQVVSKQVMQDQQAFRLQDALKNVSGVQARFSTGGIDRFISRGFDLGEVQYRNGIRLSGVNFDLANVSQVEVLKGPASGLYGRIEPGGMVNVVTKKPLDKPYYSLEQRFGSYDYYRTQFDATGPVTGDGSLAYGFDLSYLNSDSFRDVSFTDRVFVAPSLSWRPNDRLEANLNIEYLNEDRLYDNGIPAVGDNSTGFRIANVPISRQYDPEGLSDNREHVLVDFNWTYHFNEDWKFQNGVVSSSLTQKYQEVFHTSPTIDTVGRSSWFGDGQTDMHTVFVNLFGKFNTFGIAHNVLLGADYYSMEIGELDKVYAIDTVNVFTQGSTPIDSARISALPPNLRYVQNDSWFGVYFQDEMTIWDKLHIMGGGRYDWARTSSGYDDPAVFQTDTLRDSAFSPRVGISYQPWPWLSLYGNFVESFGTNNGRSESGRPFEPQTATQFEGGFKTEFFGGRLASTVAYYHLTKNNLVTADPDGGPFSVAVGEARSRGVEVDIAGKLTDSLSLIGNYAYTDAEVTKNYSGLEGKRLPYVPLHSGNVWLKYDFQQAFLKGFSIGGGVYLADKRYGDSSNSYSDSGYARVDLYAAYKRKIAGANMTAQVNLNNVTDSEYYLLRSRANNQPAEPLMVFGSLRLEY